MLLTGLGALCVFLAASSSLDLLDQPGLHLWALQEGLNWRPLAWECSAPLLSLKKEKFVT